MEARSRKTPLGLIRAENIKAALNAEVTLSIRPEHLSILPPDADGICGDVVQTRFLGEYLELTCKVKNTSGKHSEIIIYSSPQLSWPEQKCYFKPKADKITIIDPSTS